jgi:hypothetical protein
MINQLASPSVCVVDDDPKEYGPILAALNNLYVSCIHILGNEVSALPAQPFKRLQLIFLDLHLNNSVGKTAASHTANVFTKLVSTETAPIVVVIWSKYAQVQDGGDETAAELFKKTLLTAEPGYKGKLIFVEMPKPMPDARPEDWTGELRTEIEKALADQAAVEILWTWDSMVRDACMGVSEGLTAIAAVSADKAGTKLTESLNDAMQRLAKAQGEGDLSVATAPGHLVTVLTQLLMDQLDNSDVRALAAHGKWLATEPSKAAPAGFAAQMNGLLLTAAVSADTAPLMPGTVYRFSDPKRVSDLFGGDLLSLMAACTSLKPTQQKWQDWLKEAWPVLVEISPACDVAQNNRVNTLLIGGLIVPAALGTNRKPNGESFACLPLISLRWPAPEFPAQDAALIFCYRYKVAGPIDAIPDWIAPWFRLREMPTSSLRAAHSGHAARIGYVLIPE